MAKDFKSGIKTDTLQVTGGTPASGRVLTSDSSGNATWTAPSGLSNPMTAAGDLIVGGASGTPARLAPSATANRVLVVTTANSTPQYSTVSLTSMVSGSLGVANGGSGRNTATTAYGLIAAGTSATGAQQTIAPGTAGQFLRSSGTAALAAFATLAKTDVGLSNVDNTADSAKPVSTAQQTALDLKTSDSKITANGMGVCVHGTTAGTVRPTGFAQITWIGTVAPTNAVTNDIWYNG